MSAVFLFTGENAFELLAERKRWVSEFTQKHGAENLIKLDSNSVTFSDICDEVAASPFIAEKRLVIIEGIPDIEKDQWESLLHCMHPNTLLLIIAPKPDKRLGITKQILATAECRSFPPKALPKLQSWLSSYAKQNGALLSADAAGHLIATAGQNQMLLASEVVKLSTYTDTITKQHIDALVMLSEQQAVWLLMDLLVAGNTAHALRFVQRLLTAGENAHAIWNRFLWMIAQLPPVVAAVEQGNRSPQSITKQTGVNVMTVKTLIPLTSRVNQAQVKELVSLVAQFDRDLKTGVFRATAEAPEELEAIVDTCVSRVTARAR